MSGFAYWSTVGAWSALVGMGLMWFVLFVVVCWCIAFTLDCMENADLIGGLAGFVAFAAVVLLGVVGAAWITDKANDHYRWVSDSEQFEGQR